MCIVRPVRRSSQFEIQTKIVEKRGAFFGLKIWLFNYHTHHAKDHVSPSKNHVLHTAFSKTKTRENQASTAQPPRPTFFAKTDRLFVVRSLQKRVFCRSPNHLMQCRPRSDHRINPILFLNLKINQKRLAAGTRFGDSRSHMPSLPNIFAINTMRPSQLHKIRRQNRRSGIVLLIKRLLPLSNHPQKPVINHSNIDRQTLLNNGRKLRRGHLKTTIPSDHPNILLWTSDLRANRRRKRKTPSSQAPRW